MKSRVVLERLNDAVHFKATNEEGISIDIEGSEELGGKGKGVRPMQLLLMGLAGCSSMDVINILKKQRQKVGGYKVTVEAERQEEVPKLWKTAHMTFSVDGDIQPDKLKRAISLSVEKYCSVSKHLEDDVEISYGIELNGKEI